MGAHSLSLLAARFYHDFTRQSFIDKIDQSAIAVLLWSTATIASLTVGNFEHILRIRKHNASPKPVGDPLPYEWGTNKSRKPRAVQVGNEQKPETPYRMSGERKKQGGVYRHLCYLGEKKCRNQCEYVW